MLRNKKTSAPVQKDARALARYHLYSHSDERPKERLFALYRARPDRLRGKLPFTRLLRSDLPQRILPGQPSSQWAALSDGDDARTPLRQRKSIYSKNYSALFPACQFFLALTCPATAAQAVHKAAFRRRPCAQTRIRTHPPAQGRALQAARAARVPARPR